MDSFGEYLKKERKLRGVTLEEISKASNISKTYLEALENDDFASLPEEVFVRGFIRCYAENTGMDYNEVIMEYNSFTAKKKAAQTTSQNQSETQPMLNLKLSSFLAIVIFVAVSSLMILYYVKKSGEIKPSVVSEEKTSQVLDAVGVEEGEENEEKTVVLPDSDATKDIQPQGEDLIPSEEIDAKPQEQGVPDSTEPLSPLDNFATPAPVEEEKTLEVEKIPEKLTLSMTTKGRAWISMVIDDSENKEALLAAGETARWEAKKKFVISLGNAIGTSLTLNGKNIALPKARQNVIKDFTITLDNIN